jgi:formylglycine-generating enzyme required for sulfatase activity
MIAMVRRKMDAINIDWVEIPAGECIVGLSDEQKRRILKRLKRQVGGFRKLFDGNRLRLRAAESVLLHTREQRRIYLDTFYVSRYPITIEQYAAYERQSGLFVSSEWQLGRGWGRLPKMARCDDAVAFCEYLGVRLPTSDEWEKAARGPEGWLYPWGNKWDPTRANVVKKIAKKLPKDRPEPGTWATEVDAFPAGQSAYGVWDLVGNVKEWTSSWRDFPYRYSESAQARVLRRWPIKFSDDLAWLYNLLAVEHPGWEKDVGFYIGFRVVCDKLP